MTPAPDADLRARRSLTPVAHRADDRPVLLTDQRTVGDGIVFVTAGDTGEGPPPAPVAPATSASAASSFALLDAISCASVAVLSVVATLLARPSAGGRDALAISAHVVASLVLWLLCRRFALSRIFALAAVTLWLASPLVAASAAVRTPATLAAPCVLAALLLAAHRAGDRTPIRRALATALLVALAISLSPGSVLLVPAIAYQLWQRTPPVDRERHLVAPALLVLAGGVLTLALATRQGGWPASAWDFVGQPVDLTPAHLSDIDPLLPVIGLIAAVASVWQRTRGLGVGVLVAAGGYASGLHVGDIVTVLALTSLLLVSVPVVIVTRAAAPRDARVSPGAFAAPPDLRPRRVAAGVVRAAAVGVVLLAVVTWAQPWQRLIDGPAATATAAADGAALGDPAPADATSAAPSATAAPRTQTAAPTPLTRTPTAGALQLAANPSLTLSAEARRSLTAGEVDERVLTELVLLLGMHPLTVGQFAADPSDPADSVLRTAVITAIGSASPRVGGPATTRLVATLRAQRPPYAVDAVDVAGGRLTFTVAPSPAPPQPTTDSLPTDTPATVPPDSGTVPKATTQEIP